MPPKASSLPTPLYDPEVSLYESLGVSKDADQVTIKKAYYKLALAHHPDKQSSTSSETDREQATARFQRLGFAYAVLGNPERRKAYDETGDVSEGGGGGFGSRTTAEAWSAYFRDLWTGIVNESTIKEFEQTYRFSDEEKRDVVDAYVTYRGDVDGILSAVPVCSYEDEERFRKIIQSAIDAKVVRKYKAFGGPVVDPKAAARRKRKAEAEAVEAEKLWKELGLERLKKQASTKRKRGDMEQDDEPQPQMYQQQGQHQQLQKGQKQPQYEIGSTSELQLMMEENARKREDAMQALLDKYTPKKTITGTHKFKKDSQDDHTLGTRASSSSTFKPRRGEGYNNVNDEEQEFYNEPSEAEFMAAQARLSLHRKANSTAATATHGLNHKMPKAVGPDRPSGRSYQ